MKPISYLALGICIGVLAYAICHPSPSSVQDKATNAWSIVTQGGTNFSFLDGDGRIWSLYYTNRAQAERFRDIYKEVRRENPNPIVRSTDQFQGQWRNAE